MLALFDEHPELYFDLMNSLVSLDYTPPTAEQDIEIHLLALWLWYKSDFLPELVAKYLDWSLCKLLINANVILSHRLFTGERDLARTKKIALAKKKKSDLKKTFVLEIYYRDKRIEKGMKLNTVISRINKTFGQLKSNEEEIPGVGKIPKELETPSRDQIRRYLSQEGMIDKDFEKVGRFLIKHI